MISIPKLLRILVVIVIVLITLSASANMGPLKSFKGGGVVAPKTPHETIRLDSEEVIISLKPNTYTVDAVFNLINTGETTIEWAGFPKWTASRTRVFPDFIKFEGWLNNEPITFKEEKDRSADVQESQREALFAQFDQFTDQDGQKIGEKIEKRNWLVSHVTFPAHAKTTIRVKYEAPYVERGASYILGTGSLWKDNISKALFIIDGTEIGGADEFSTWFVKEKETQSKKQVTGNVVKYELLNFKPHPEEQLFVGLTTLQRLHREALQAIWKRQKSRPGAIPMAPPPPMPMKVPK
jgi:hypothetical protein